MHSACFCHMTYSSILASLHKLKKVVQKCYNCEIWVTQGRKKGLSYPGWHMQAVNKMQRTF